MSGNRDYCELGCSCLFAHKHEDAPILTFFFVLCSSLLKVGSRLQMIGTLDT